MKEITVVIIFVLWYTLSVLISERLGKKKRLGVEWSFFYCMVLSPVIGFVITLLSNKK